MSFESDLQELLKTATGHPVYWDATPENFRVANGAAVLLLQQVGGKSQWYVEKDGPMPSHKHARIQVTVMSTSRVVAAPLARLVEDTIAQSDFVSEPYGAPVGISDDELKLFGSHQQFGMWFADP